MAIYAACECESAWSIHSEILAQSPLFRPGISPSTPLLRMRSAVHPVPARAISPVQNFSLARAQPWLRTCAYAPGAYAVQCLLVSQANAGSEIATTWTELDVPAISVYDESDMLEIFQTSFCFPLAILKRLLRTYSWPPRPTKDLLLP